MKLTYAGLTTEFEAMGACHRGGKLRYTVTVRNSNDKVIFHDETLESPNSEGLEVYCTLWSFLLHYLSLSDDELYDVYIDNPPFAHKLAAFKKIGVSDMVVRDYETLIYYLENNTVEQSKELLCQTLPSILPDEPDECPWIEVIEDNLSMNVAEFIDYNLEEEEQLQQFLNLI